MYPNILKGAQDRFIAMRKPPLTKIEGVAQVTTSFALRPVVYKTALPV